MWGLRVIIPTSLQAKVLAELHEGHVGIVCMKALARMHVWWPHIDHNIELLVGGCDACQRESRDPPQVFLHPWTWPTNQCSGFMLILLVPLWATYFD